MNTKAKHFRLKSFLNYPDEAFHIARTTIHSKHDLTLHDHDYAEVFWIKEGSGVHLINGEEVELKLGLLCMIRPGDTHTFKLSKKSKALVITNIAFHSKSLDLYRERYFPGSNSYFWTRELSPFIFSLTPNQLNELSSMTDCLLYRKRDFIRLDLILLHVFRLVSSSPEVYDKIPMWLIYAIENFNSPNFFKKGISGFVELTNRSQDHVNRILKKHLCQTLSQVVNKAKLQYAASQLIMTNAPIKTICFDCGYDTISYFYRMFKSHYALTPNDFRVKNHKIF